MTDFTARPIGRRLLGATTPAVRPGDDPALLGAARLSPLGPVTARSYQTFRLVYTVGRLGLDDTGAIRVAFRIVTDFGKLQASDPAAPNYVSAKAPSGRIRLEIGPQGERPFNHTVTARLSGGCLAPGDEIELIFGDVSGGSPGWLMQTYAEEGFEFRVSADVQATGAFALSPDMLAVRVIAGPPSVWRAVLPTLRRPGEPFALGIKAEDVWGNPSPFARARLRLIPSIPVQGLPETLDYAPEDRALTLEGLTAGPGELRIKVMDEEEELAEAGPLLLREGDEISLWGDLHGQTGETVGVNSIQSYFDFARNKAFLDVSAHQGNDFQINAAFWSLLNEETARWNEPGRFTTLPGYEWSGNTAVGGDHNVYFAEEGRSIIRCSHALLEDRAEAGRDAHTLTDLYAALRDEDAVIYAHVGGRYADIGYDHDPKLETAVEIHSAWGTFEWIASDSFALGRRIGIVANSDGHKGRPGASWPGASTFGAYGGLTCFLAPSNDRAAVMAAQRARRHYATTGCRLHLGVTAHLGPGAVVYDCDPAAWPDAAAAPAAQARMGDIVASAGAEVEIEIEAIAASGIERIELRRGAEVLETLRPYGEADLGARLRLTWEGAEYRGRGRETVWRGRADFPGARIDRISRLNHWNPERRMELVGADQVVFDTLTTGNFTGFDAWLDEGPEAALIFTAAHARLERPLAEIGLEGAALDAGGLGRCVWARRLPEGPLPRRLAARRRVALPGPGDAPIWVCAALEDGHLAWSSPIYFIPG